MEWQSARSLAAQIRERRLTSLQCVNFFAERIAQLDQRYNLVVVRLFEAARARAAEADRATEQGVCWGPLHGVPCTVKESFAMTGVQTSCALERLRDHRPKSDAAAVERLLAAGAIIIGKTNVPVGAGDMQSYNTLYGTSNNPWDVSRSPGGSSGGSAGALAAGFSPFEVGSDLAGSIRTPAHCCGVLGLKPTLGVVDSSGHVPPAPFHSLRSNLFVVGPMARCCSDLALLLDVLVGPRSEDQDAWRVALPAPTFLGQQPRVAVCC